MKHVKSGIPSGVIEKPGRAYTDDGVLSKDLTVDCFLRGRLVGRRVYNRDGILVLETPMKNGLKHGREITRTDDGQLRLIEPYMQGKVHGTAKQYGRNGNIIGTYTLVHGTGFDLWRQEEEDGTVYVSEIHSLQDGFPHGFEWGFASSKEDLWLERHWHRGKMHGIERVWNRTGRLRRGYPRFYIDDRPVLKRKYIKMALTERSLPAYREVDNLPDREWPLDLKRLFSSQTLQEM